MYMYNIYTQFFKRIYLHFTKRLNLFLELKFFFIVIEYIIKSTISIIFKCTVKKC